MSKPCLRRVAPKQPFEVEAWIDAVDELARERGDEWDGVAGTRRGVVCLHSSLKVGGLGRWTLVASCPVAEIRGPVGAVDLSIYQGGGWRVVETFADPFEALDALLAPHRGHEAELPCWLPFRAGAVGVLGYECLSAVEPTVAVRRPSGEPDLDEPDVWFGFYETFALRDLEKDEGWVVSLGIGRWGEAPTVDDAGSKADRLKTLLETHTARGEPDAVEVELRPSIGRPEYDRAVGSILDSIAAGHFYQACFTYPMVGPRRNTSARALFLALEAQLPAPFSALLATGGVALAGASPERFLAIVDGQATARPMKGTRARGSCAHTDQELREELVGSAKDRAENLMIVDLVRNDLGRVCVAGSIRVPSLFEVETYSTVHQLTSTITGSLRPDKRSIDAVRASFPAGSMTGAPKVEAMRRIHRLESHRRGWYSGALGWIDLADNANLSVVIRSAIMTAEQVRWHVGGGIVADSTVVGEWRESQDKCPALFFARGSARSKSRPS